MLFGSQKKSASTPSDNAFVFDAGTEDFEERVLRASLEKPVIVDFWAPWCGPCKQLGPALEKAVAEANGAVLMAKVNVDENQQLAAALRIQSIPTVFAFFQGRPVDAFMGAQPESQIKTFVSKLIALANQNAPGAIDIPETLKAAAQALADKDIASAQALYSSVLEQDENNAQAYAGLARAFIATGEFEDAQHVLDSAPDSVKKSAALAEAKTALDLAQNAPQGGDFAEFEKKIQKDPNDYQARIDLALAQFAGGAKEQAIDTLIESIRRDREWNEQAARKQLLKFFEALGGADPLTAAGRKKLSAVLFS